MEHLAVGPLEVLPILALGEDLVDGLERLQLRRIEIERRVEAIHRRVRVANLVSGDDRDGISVLGLGLNALVQSRNTLDGLDDFRPALGLLEHAEQLVQRRVIFGPDVASVGVRWMASSAFFSFSLQVSPISIRSSKRSASSSTLSSVCCLKWMTRSHFACSA